jgi:hypothetical protein
MATAIFMQATFEFAIKQTGTEGCQILLEAGIDAYRAFHFAIRARSLSICQLLVRDDRADPFLREESYENDSDDGGDGSAEPDTAATSPFLAAARLSDTRLFECLLATWNERFTSTGGKSSVGNYPLHVVCCDPLVSLQAIKLLINRNADVPAIVDGEQELLPFQIAAMWDASLDVIFYLLQHCPDALSHDYCCCCCVPFAALQDRLDRG